MGTKSTAKLLKMIPREIRAIIMERPILTSECQDEYDNLLLCFAETYKPKDLLQWFDVKRACVLSWEEQRMPCDSAAGAGPAITSDPPSALTPAMK
jgi:hypothetical protein